MWIPSASEIWLHLVLTRTMRTNENMPGDGDGGGRGEEETYKLCPCLCVCSSNVPFVVPAAWCSRAFPFHRFVKIGIRGAKVLSCSKSLTNITVLSYSFP